MIEAITAIGIFVFLNAFFVLSEFAIVGTDEFKFKAKYGAKGSILTRIALKQLNNIDFYLASSQVGITIASLALGWVGEPLLAKVFEGSIEHIEFLKAFQTPLAHTLAASVSFMLITAIHIILGEQLPKLMGIASPERWMTIIALPLEIFSTLLYPFILFLQVTVNKIAELLSLEVKGEAKSKGYSSKELEVMFREFKRRGILPSYKVRMLSHVLKLDEVNVEEVVIPRPDVIAVPVDASLGSIVKLAMKYKHSRYPVYKDSLDDIVGILHLKDLFLALYKGYKYVDNGLKPLLREALYIPENSSLLSALDMMKKAKLHMLIVLDEYGGTKGIVTMEDIVEFIMGEVSDEFDEIASDPILKVSDNRFIVDGTLNLNELKDAIGLDLKEGLEEDVLTVGGLVFSILGRVPKVGDEIELNGVTLRVLRVKGRRASRIELIIESKQGRTEEST